MFFKLFRSRTGWWKFLRARLQIADNFRINSFPCGNLSWLAPYLQLFQWRLSDPYRLALLAAARLARPFVRPWIRSCVGPKMGLPNLDTRKTSSFSRESNHSSWVVQLLSYLYRGRKWQWNTIYVNLMLQWVNLPDSVMFHCASVS
jgi:hypothetical protein